MEEKQKIDKYAPKYPYYYILKAKNKFFRQICPRQRFFLAPCLSCSYTYEVLKYTEYICPQE